MPKYIKPTKQWVIWGGEIPGGGVRLLASDQIMQTDFMVTSFSSDPNELRMWLHNFVEIRGETFEQCLLTLFNVYKNRGDTWQQSPEQLAAKARELTIEDDKA